MLKKIVIMRMRSLYFGDLAIINTTNIQYWYNRKLFFRIVDDYQTHHRLREATARKRAEDLNERVTYWSLGQTAVVVLIGVGQVYIEEICYIQYLHIYSRFYY
jgi:hypothetical protein